MAADTDLIYTRADFDTAVTAAVLRGREEERAASAEALKPYDGKTAAELRAEGAKAERERIAAIGALAEAKGHEAVAHDLAVTTDMTPETVKAVLSKLPKHSALAARASQLPNIGVDSTIPDGQAEIDKGYQAIADELNRRHGLSARK